MPHTPEHTAERDRRRRQKYPWLLTDQGVTSLETQIAPDQREAIRQRKYPWLPIAQPQPLVPSGQVLRSPEDQGLSPFLRGVTPTGEPIPPIEGFPSAGTQAVQRAIGTGVDVALETQGALAELGTRLAEFGGGGSNPLAAAILASGGDASILPNPPI